jgi:hypothetical protein
MSLATAVSLAALAVATPASAQYWRGHGWHGHTYYGGWGRGVGFGVGVGIGAGLANSYAYQPGYYVEDDPGVVVESSQDDAYCSAKYRSYDPESGTYLGYDGQRHPCP